MNLSSDSYQHWLERVTEYGCDLQNAPEEYKNNSRIVIAAVQEDDYALRFASPSLQNDEDVVLEAVHFGAGEALEFASPSLRSDKGVVWAAVIQGGEALQYASPPLRNDKQVVMDAVTKDGRALKYASPSLQNDKIVVMASVKSNYLSWDYVPPSLKQDKDVVTAFWISKIKESETSNRRTLRILAEAPLYMRSNKIFMTVAVQKDPRTHQYLSPSLLNDEEFDLDKVWSSKINASRDLIDVLLEDAPPQIRINKKIMIAAAKKNRKIIKYAPRSLLNDEELWMSAFTNTWDLNYAQIFKDAPDNIRNNKDVVIAAVSCHADNIKYAHQDLQRDRDVLIAARMFDEGHQDAAVRKTDASKRIVLSTRFSLNEWSYSLATEFTAYFKSSIRRGLSDVTVYALTRFCCCWKDGSFSS